MNTYLDRASHWITFAVLGLILAGCGNGRPSTTSLHDAARMNDPIALKAALMNAPGGVDMRDSHMETPFIAGSKVHALDAMQVLLASGADINARDNEGYTALMWSVYGNQPNTTKFLIEHGADPNLRNNKQETPLLLAAKDGYGEVVAELVYHNTVAPPPGTPVVVAAPPGTPGPVTPGPGTPGPVTPPPGTPGPATPAVITPAPAVAVMGIVHKTDLDAVDTRKWTALEYAVKGGRQDIVKLLTERGAYPDTHDNDGWTPLLYAADYGYFEIVKMLVEEGANPNLRAPDGVSPLIKAQKHGYADMAAYLMSKGAQ